MTENNDIKDTLTEKKRPRKEIIKSIAIVFLAVMLVLTFFSNTIMNMSLPQVSVQYAESAEVSEQIKGSGTVTTGESYKVSVNETRVISAVNFKVGDSVNKGDVIYTLEGTESTELDEAEKTLKDLEYEYKKAVIAAGEGAGYRVEQLEIDNAKDEISDIERDIERFDTPEYLREKYASDYLQIENLKKDIEELEANTNADFENINDTDLEIYQSELSDALTGLESDDYTLLPTEWYDKLTAAKENVDKLSESDKETLTNKKTEIEGYIAALSTEDMLGLPTKYYNKIESALNTYTEAKEAYEKAETELKEAQAALTDDSSDSIRSKNREVEQKMKEYNQAMSDIASYTGTDANEIQDLYDKLDSISLELKYLQEDLNDLMEEQSINNVTQNKVRAKQSVYNNKKYAYEKAEAALNKIKKEIRSELIDELNAVKVKLESLSETDENGKSELDAAKKTLSELKAECKKELKTKSTKVTREIENRKSLEEKKTSLETAQASFDVKIANDKKTLEDSLKEKKTNLKTLEANLSVKKITDDVTNKQTQVDLDKQENAIAEQRKTVNKLKEKSLGGEITAPVSGVISSLSYKAGETTVSGNDAAVIDMTDKGFILSFSVKTEQARKLTVGTNADVTSNYFGSDISATLSKISTDSSNPQTNKILEFTVTGADVKSGDQISVAIGAKGQQYSAVVPNSAIRSDSNGKYVLVCESKNSALGSRYFAVRYSVNVLASNDSKTAVSGLTGSEFVITSSSSPIEDGTQVKLAE